MDATWAADVHTEVREIVGFRVGKAKVDALVDLVYRWVQAEGWDHVDVIGSRVRVETVEVYGLRIGLDAMGQAVSVACDRGFE